MPAAVTAFSPLAIENLQIQTVQDLSRLVPNVKFDPVTAGTTSLKPFIRGGGVADGGQIKCFIDTSSGDVVMDLGEEWTPYLFSERANDSEPAPPMPWTIRAMTKSVSELDSAQPSEPRMGISGPNGSRK